MSRPIPIRINILANFLIVIGLISAILLGLQYHFSHRLAMDAARGTFSQIADKATLFTTSAADAISGTLDLAVLNPSILKDPGPEVEDRPILLLRAILVQRPGMYAAYAGHGDGSFTELINMQSGPGLHDHFDASPSARWTVVQVSVDGGHRVRHYRFLDGDFSSVGAREEVTDYDPRLRVWYTLAMRSEGVVRTNPYMYSELKAPGITYAKRVPGTETVVGLDVTMDRLDAFLAGQRFAEGSELYLFDSEGTVIAASEADQSTPGGGALLQRITEAEGQEPFRIESEDGKEYLAFVAPVNLSMDGGEKLGILVPMEVMVDPYMRTVQIALGAALVFLLLSIPLVLYSTSQITRPIRALMKENEKVKDRRFGEVKPVDTNIKELVELSDSLLAMSESIQAYQRAQEELMDSFIRLIADTIDAKSPYTGGHCRRVPELAILLAEAAHDSEEGPFQSFRIEGDEAWREFRTGAWLHDCGKVTTPAYVVDKATKLETIYNRVHEVRTRFEVLWRDAQIERLRREKGGEDPAALDKWLQTRHAELLDDFAFIAECNMGGEFMSDEKKERVRSIASQTWIRHFDNTVGISEDESTRLGEAEPKPLPAEERLLDDKPAHVVERAGFDHAAYETQGFKLEVPENLYNLGEVYNLCIEKGTLTDEERFKINEHVIMTIRMLEQLPLPEGMKRVPEYAGTHHETMVGTGYPRRLRKEQLSIHARITAIADIFEALTASYRPYKKTKTLSGAIKIMSFMRNDSHIDPDLFALFLRSGVFRTYAETYMQPDQIDEVDIDQYLN